MMMDIPSHRYLNMFTDFDSSLVTREVSTFYVSGNKMPVGYDETDAAWQVKSGKDWIDVKNNIRPSVDASDLDQYRAVFEFEWFRPVDLSERAVTECNRVYTAFFGEPMTFYDLAISPNGIKLAFNSFAQNSRKPDNGGRGQGMVNNVLNIAEQYYDLVAEQDKAVRDECKLELATLSGKDKTAFMKQKIAEWSDKV